MEEKKQKESGGAGKRDRKRERMCVLYLIGRNKRQMMIIPVCL